MGGVKYIVELMRQGKNPKDTGLEALRRIADNTIDKRLLDAGGGLERINFEKQHV
jgi:hypothetical protein